MTELNKIDYKLLESLISFQEVEGLEKFQELLINKIKSLNHLRENNSKVRDEIQVLVSDANKSIAENLKNFKPDEKALKAIEKSMRKIDVSIKRIDKIKETHHLDIHGVPTKDNPLSKDIVLTLHTVDYFKKHIGKDVENINDKHFKDTNEILDEAIRTLKQLSLFVNSSLVEPYKDKETIKNKI